MDVIATHGLTKHYGDVRALEGLDLMVGAGEVFGFLGPNGAGKTTTIRLLMGLLGATSGNARIFDRDAFHDAVTLHARMGYLPSEPAFPSGMSGRDYLDHLARLRGMTDTALRTELADRFELDLSRPIQTLSRGNRQKLGIVQAFAHAPELVILDEPSTGLDPLKQATLAQLVREVVGKGRTVFLSSHVIAEVEQVADRVGIVRSGVLVALETVERLRARALRRATIRFTKAVDPAPFAAIPEVHSAEAQGEMLLLTITGSMDRIVKEAAGYEVMTFSSDDADLSEVFLSFYEDAPRARGDQNAPRARGDQEPEAP
jgi:ABC-2 type transport system ATP-binding protein